MTDFKNILVNIDHQIGFITINRPKQLNALNKITIEELHAAFKLLNEDEQVRVIIVTGVGEKAFVAGADIKEFMNFTAEQGRELAALGQELLFDYVENLETPVIAAINGFALGGGLELALASHIRMASENAKMGLPEVSLGVIPGYGGTQRLAQIIGKGRALDMILTAEMKDAVTALNYGLVTEVSSADTLMETAVKKAKKLIKNSPKAQALAIKAVNASYFKEGFEVEKDLFGQAFTTEDFKEGTTAFVERRKPDFTGK
ncbi:MAG TPA: enoyl-CoA hydratase [Flavobacteriia bacterium]|jgi:enoyl-CoA hydratase|nr:enoyl-CoA hydratase [Flavobacteriia bacterium]